MTPNTRVGILGGGKLSSMLIRYAIDYGMHISMMDRVLDSSDARYTEAFTSGDPTSYDDVMGFGSNVDVVTIGTEQVNVEALKALELAGIKVHPSAAVIQIMQDKATQKGFLRSKLVPVIPGILVDGQAALYRYVNRLPGRLKKCKSGYDNRDIMMLRTAEDISSAFDEPAMLEELADIKDELSVILSRTEAGTIECYDPITMIFNKERLVLDFQLCPANVNCEQALEACRLAIRIAESLDLVGMLTVEMFVTANGKLLVDNLALRPRKKEHSTSDDCSTCYEQQLRAILDLSMEKEKLSDNTVAVKILEPAAMRKEAMQQALKTVLGVESLHLYANSKGRLEKRTASIVLTEQTMENASSKAVILRHLLKSNHE